MRRNQIRGPNLFITWIEKKYYKIVKFVGAYPLGVRASMGNNPDMESMGVGHQWELIR